MLKNLKGFVAGFLCCVIIIASTGFVFGDNQSLDAMFKNIKIVIDGKEIHPTDASGGSIEPFIVNGTTYLPVRAVAEAFGKAVQWDGPTYTVYIGDMDGKLEYPTITFRDLESVSADKVIESKTAKDNYEKIYGETYYADDTKYLLNMKYSKFKGTIMVPFGSKETLHSVRYRFIADGKTIYTSPIFSYDTRPVEFEVDITGVNNFEIERVDGGYYTNDPLFADCGFYQ